MPLPLDKLTKLLPLLGSSQINEAHAALSAVNRLLANNKASWHDVVKVLSSSSVRPEPFTRTSDPWSRPQPRWSSWAPPQPKKPKRPKPSAKTPPPQPGNYSPTELLKLVMRIKGSSRLTEEARTFIYDIHRRITARTPLSSDEINMVSSLFRTFVD